MNVRVTGAGGTGGAAQGSVPDVAMKIALAMRALHIAPVPANYRILHEVFAGGNQALNAEFAALGSRPRQKDLDAIGIRHFPAASGALVVEAMRERLASQVEAAMALVRKEQARLQSFGALLGETSQGLDRRSDAAHEFLDRVAAILLAAAESRIGQGSQLAAAIVDRTAELGETKARLDEYRRLADLDPLTGLANRRVFDLALRRLFGSPPELRGGALVLIDIDHFKRINDCLGHPVGDRVLRQVARAVEAAAPQALVLARTGGEEFAAVLQGVGGEAALAAAEAIRAGVAGRPFEIGGRRPAIVVTVSAGVATAAQAAGPDELYARADRALYRSKADGRNRATLSGRNGE